MDWKTLLAYITGTVDQELLLRNAYLVTENRLLRQQIKGRVRLSDGERKTLAEIGYKLGKHALEDVATIVKPDTILGWHRKLVAQKFDGSYSARPQGVPPSIRSWRPWSCAWPRRIEFIPLSFWYDAPLTSRDSDRRHDPWLVYGSPSCSLARWSSWISRA